MKTLNSSSKMSAVKTPSAFDDCRMPCWYADFEKGKTRKSYTWKVGVKSDKKDEYSFKASKIGNVNDEDVWKRINSPEFAVDLIGKFRDGGREAVKEWVDAGCP